KHTLKAQYSDIKSVHRPCLLKMLWPRINGSENSLRDSPADVNTNSLGKLKQMVEKAFE
ncbi:Hypothetical predicted protein, partial [Pelobates cultripes]